MATAAVQHAPGNTLDQVVGALVQDNKIPKKHNVETQLHYYDDPGDGTPPTPFYIGYSLNTNRVAYFELTIEYKKVRQP